MDPSVLGGVQARHLTLASIFFIAVTIIGIEFVRISFLGSLRGVPVAHLLISAI
jgi:hypothetical protein